MQNDAKIGAWIRVTGNEQSFNGTQSSEGIVSADLHAESSSEEELLDAHSSEGPVTDLNLRLYSSLNLCANMLPL